MSKEPRPSQQQTPVDKDVYQRRRRRWLHIALSGVGTLFMSWVIIYCVPRVVDTVRAYNFDASVRVVSVKRRLKLSDRATDIFYASSPVIQSKDELNKNCQTQERTTAILGCFYQDKIYLYDLKNTELDGTLEVTAAHEMLHAAYQRLTVAERIWLDKRIVAQYEKVKNDATIKALMAYYSKAEPGAEVDELHSILGTTIATLTPDLEGYYARYFTDRATVVALNTKYNAVFGELKEKAAVLEAKIATAEPEITQALTAYETDRVQLEQDIADFNARATAGTFTSQSTFVVERNALMLRVDELNARHDEINAKVDAYNADIAELNKLSTRTTELYKSMNGATGMEKVE